MHTLKQVATERWTKSNATPHLAFVLGRSLHKRDLTPARHWPAHLSCRLPASHVFLTKSHVASDMVGQRPKRFLPPYDRRRYNQAAC